jgi:hypothetical protein
MLAATTPKSVIGKAHPTSFGKAKKKILIFQKAKGSPLWCAVFSIGGDNNTSVVK